MATFGRIAENAAELLRMQSSYNGGKRRFLLHLLKLESMNWTDLGGTQTNAFAFAKLTKGERLFDPQTEAMTDEAGAAIAPGSFQLDRVGEIALGYGGTEESYTDAIWRTLNKGLPMNWTDRYSSYPSFYEFKQNKIVWYPIPQEVLWIRMRVALTSLASIDMTDIELEGHRSSVPDDLLYAGLVWRLAEETNKPNVRSYQEEYMLTKRQFRARDVSGESSGADVGIDIGAMFPRRESG